MFKRVKPGEAVKAEQFNALLDYIEANQLRSGVGYRVKRGVGGTSLAITSQGGVSAAPKRGRFEVYGALLTGAQWSVKVAYGIVYETNIRLGDDPSDQVDTKIHNPTIDGSELTVSPPPQLDVTTGDFIYLRIATDEFGLITGATIEAFGTEQESLHHYPTDEAGSGAAGDYFYLLANFSVASGVPSIDQKFESDLQFGPDIALIESAGGTASVVKEYDEDTGFWKFRGVSGEDYDAPTLNEELVPDPVGLNVSEGANAVNVVTQGVSTILYFKRSDETTNEAELHIKNGLIYKVVAPTDGIIEYCPDCGTTGP